AGLEVDLIGYAGSQVHPSVAEHPRIHLRLLGMSFPSGLSRPLYLLLLPIKLIAQVLCFLWVLCIATPPPDFYLLQNPPTIPTFTVVRFAGLVRRASFVIDWHNFGFTLFGLRFGPAHPLVKIHKWYETTIARQAAAHICVTRAMQQELANNWDIRATVLYDRPPAFFRPSSLEEMRVVLGRIDQSLLDSCFSPPAPGTTQWTLRPDRPALVVSSSSWTADEDFDVLLEAALMYDRRVAAMAGEGEFGGEGGASAVQHPNLVSLPSLLLSGATVPSLFSLFPFTSSPLCSLSSLSPRTLPISRLSLPSSISLFPPLGKGALRSHYEAKMRRLRLRHVSFRTAWLAPEDYPRLLGLADLGVSLHTSSSGLDLPMKVVDMFGCGLPVCAISYSCIHELVKDGTNGLLFSDSSELASQLVDIFCGFPEGSVALKPHSPSTTYSSAFASSSSSAPLSTPPTSPTSPSSAPSSVTLLQKLRSGALATGAAGKWADEWGVNVLPLVERLSGGDLRGVMR
ncbi:unnamed protein product, partial [Closterium sp. Naga37s-1]